MQLLFPVLIFVFLYLLLIRPQQQRVRRQQSLLSNLAVGDEVVTAGGVIGRIQALGRERARIEVAPGVTMEFLRGAITRRLEPATEAFGDHEPDEDDGGTTGADATESRPGVTEPGSGGTGPESGGTALGPGEVAGGPDEGHPSHGGFPHRPDEVS